MPSRAKRQKILPSSGTPPPARHEPMSFDKLPTEIRWKIWDLSLVRHRLIRAIPIMKYAGNEWSNRPFPVEPILVNRDSYNATIKFCRASKEKTWIPALPNFNPAYDTLFADWSVFRTGYVSTFSKVGPKPPRVGMLQSINDCGINLQSIAMDRSELTKDISPQHIQVLLHLKELYISLGVARETRYWVIPTKRPEEFATTKWPRWTTEKRTQGALKRSKGLVLKLLEVLEENAVPDGRLPAIIVVQLCRAEGLLDGPWNPE